VKATFDVDLVGHRKVDEAMRRGGSSALSIYVVSILWSVRELTDGHVPRDVALDFAGRYGFTVSPEGFFRIAEDPQHLISALLDAGLWETASAEGQPGRPTPQASGYQIHDFGDYQPTKSKLAEVWDRATRKRDRDRERQRKRRSERDLPISRDPPISTLPPKVFPSSRRAGPGASDLPENEEPKPVDVEPFERLAAKVDGVDDSTVSRWRNASRGLPAEWACGRAYESVVRLRSSGQKLRRTTEAGYVTATLTRLREERE
jgi:hypothetical protein